MKHIGSKYRASRTTAFTLVEIMIVVVIIGLLAAMAMIAFQKIRQTSQLNVCLNNLRIYQDALELYAFPKGLYPDQINDMVTQGFLNQPYECPIDGPYDWSVKSGNLKYHLQCKGQHTASIAHVCIHENQRPAAK